MRSNPDLRTKARRVTIVALAAATVALAASVGSKPASAQASHSSLTAAQEALRDIRDRWWIDSWFGLAAGNAWPTTQHPRMHHRTRIPKMPNRTAWARAL
jgi:hypothetical protein